MRFTKPFWDGIADGSVTVAYRGWTRPTVVVGRPYRTGGGRIEVVAVDQIEPSEVTDTDAARAGYASGPQALSQVRTDGDRRLYRVEFRRLAEPDPRAVLAAEADLDQGAVEEITTKLVRLDRASVAGPWTHPTLRLIEANPGRRAPDLAEMAGRETKPFKLDVRKLKNLGLTLSLRIGYELSPRGRAYLDALDALDDGSAPGPDISTMDGEPP